MRFVCVAIGLLLLAGCGKTTGIKTAPPTIASPVKASPVKASPTKAQPVVVAPDFRARGKIQSVNNVSRFVVVNFSLASLPALGAQLTAYRENLKVGLLKVTGPQEGPNIVADIVAGDVRVDDEVREE